MYKDFVFTEHDVWLQMIIDIAMKRKAEKNITHAAMLLFYFYKKCLKNSFIPYGFEDNTG
jgi:hypothetical protein